MAIFTFYMVRKVICCALRNVFVTLRLCIPSKEIQLESSQVDSGAGKPYFKAIPSSMTQPSSVLNVNNDLSRFYKGVIGSYHGICDLGNMLPIAYHKK